MKFVWLHLAMMLVWIVLAVLDYANEDLTWVIIDGIVALFFMACAWGAWITVREKQGL